MRPHYGLCFVPCLPAVAVCQHSGILPLQACMAPCKTFMPCLQKLAAQTTGCLFSCAGPSSSPTAQGPGLADSNTGSSHIFHLLDFSPEWDFTAGGVKMLVTGTLGADSDSFRSLHIMFDQQEVRPDALPQ